MKIIADQNIPLVHEFFSELGEVITLPGRSLANSDLSEADVLLVRSITPVNQGLLEHTPVKFVGSCTIGYDHLDVGYLSQRGIAWANAPGCNANAVLQYALSAMSMLRPEWRQQTIGIMGCGNIGGRLYRCLTSLGVRCRVYDPFFTKAMCPDLVDFSELLGADIISCHTPLTRTGAFPSHHLLNQQTLSYISNDTLLMNCGRGGMIDNQALKAVLQQRPSLSIVLDVWENEPDIDRALLDLVQLGTPHIAGYSTEGKEQGTYQIYQSVCAFLGETPDPQKHRLLSQDKAVLPIGACVKDQPISEQINTLLHGCYDIRRDDQMLRSDKNFDGLRKNYSTRRDYSHFELPSDFDGSPLSQFLKTIQQTNRELSES